VSGKIPTEIWELLRCPVDENEKKRILLEERNAAARLERKATAHDAPQLASSSQV